VITRLTYRFEVLKLSHEIGRRTRRAMEGRNREFLLREQLKSIQQELDGAEEASPDLDDLKSESSTRAACPRMSPPRPDVSCGGWSGCPRVRRKREWFAPTSNG
jgi:hypothetical protein